VGRRLRVPDDLPVRGVTVAQVTGPKGRAFTEEQARAVLDRDGDLLLSAAAGSGKTSVLVERFVRMVTEDGLPPGRILAITFTEKAAGELRHRIRERLLELGERDLAREAESAWISTIHGFCARLLRGHAVAAGLDPAFAVLDDTVARGLRQEAWERAYAAWLAERGEVALDLAAAFTTDRLREAIEDVHDVLRSQGFTHPRLPVPAPVPAPDHGELLRLRDLAAAALDPGDDRKTVVRAARALERCREIFAALDDGAIPERAVLDQACFKPGNTSVLKGPECAAYLAEHERYAEACAAHRASRAAAELDVLLDRFARAYADVKRARSGLDFDDLELMARDLLAGSDAIRRATQERFARVMVDEFQDSSPRQVVLFDLVGSGNVFVVGDELQSIYGFRHADVEVFRARRATLATTGRTQALTQNFRSRAPILEAVNAAFADRFGEGFTPLVPGRADAREAGAPEVEVLLTGTDGWEEVDLGTLPRAQAWRHAEARLLAQRLADLVAEGTAPEDVVVLLRSATDLPVYERALEEAGLQTLAAGGRGYWARQVVRDLCAWLAALANPRDEEQLYGVLASPLVGLSTDALALIAEAGGRGGAWTAIEQGAVDARLGAADRERLAAFRERFRYERRMLPRLALDELLRRAIEATDYDLHVLRLPGGARRLANVHKLLRLAADHERAHGRDVRGLVDRAAEELEADARETDAPVELGDAKAVRIMTIHAAKGLEFPVVAVADLGRRPQFTEAPLLVDGDRLGVRLPSIAGGREYALDFRALREERRAAEAAEEDRVLYVALTRARERLILSGALRLDPWPDASRPGAPPIAWLATALAGGRPPVEPGEEADEGEQPGGGERRAEARARFAISTPETVGAVLRRESLAPAGRALADAPPPPARPPVPLPQPPAPRIRALSYTALSLWKRCGYRFYLQRVLRLPEDEETGGRPPAREDDGTLEARLRGSLTHAALEAEAGDPAELARAAADSFGVELTGEEVADIAAMVERFRGTELAERLRAAGRVRREHVFSFPLGDTMLTGVVDVLAHEEDGTVLVVDYKTDRLAPGETPEALVDREYDVQRRLYALAALRGGAPGVEVAYAFLDAPSDPVTAVFTPEDVPRLEQELSALAEGIHEGRYEVAAEPHIGLCAGCPGRAALCRWPPEMTARELPAQAGS
jgi:ATP-dependent exoDNAse (exonuclease V) beta subunit